MRVTMIAVSIMLLAGVETAGAQEPYNVTVNVTELSRIFTDLYGPDGLVVNSLATLAGGVSHSAHFNSGFESEFSQFGTALTGQIVSLPLPASRSSGTAVAADCSAGRNFMIRHIISATSSSPTCQLIFCVMKKPSPRAVCFGPTTSVNSAATLTSSPGRRYR